MVVLPCVLFPWVLLLWRKVCVLPPLFHGGAAACLHALTEVALAVSTLAVARALLLNPDRLPCYAGSVVAGLVLLSLNLGFPPLRDALVLVLLAGTAWRGPQDQEYSHAV